MKIRLSKTKQSKSLTYRLCLITENYYYYINYSEGDLNGNTLMYSRDTDVLISDNYFAYTALEEDLEQESYLWVSRNLKKCYLEHIKVKPD